MFSLNLVKDGVPPQEKCFYVIEQPSSSLLFEYRPIKAPCLNLYINAYMLFLSVFLVALET